MKLQIQRDFQQLQICKEENEKYKDMCTPNRVIVDVDKVVHLCKGFCKVDGCGKERGVVGRKLQGGVLVVVQLLSSKIVHFCDKSMKVCMITTSHVTNNF